MSPVEQVVRLIEAANGFRVYFKMREILSRFLPITMNSIACLVNESNLQRYTKRGQLIHTPYSKVAFGNCLADFSLLLSIHFDIQSQANLVPNQKQ